MCTIYIPLIVRKPSACAGDTNFSNSVTVTGGGWHGSPAKQNFTTSIKMVVSPVACTLSDVRRSEIINYLNF
jgi:hypothetical protein